MKPLVRSFRMVVTDIDGTLVDSFQEISELNKEKIHAFQRQGGIVTLATGRMEDAAYRFVQEMDIRHPVILYNGGKIVDFTTNQCYFEAVLTTEVVLDALQLLSRNPLNMIFYSEQKLWVREINSVISDYMNKDRVVCHAWESPDFLLRSKVNKILIIQEDQNFDAVLEVFLPMVGASCELVTSEATYMEILPFGVSKGNALKLLADQVGVEMQDVIAIGDHMNDLAMLQEAGLGVAVNNAHPDLKEHAQYIAPSNLEHAVAHVIDKYCLNKAQESR
ncbi:Cof-type HAD-IIB family hydrolase [Paenibacillus dakarensis]|uniref:Cof-type HAD-IIB family hydrolase n=1 Tax=Paenibacillus dakarensis TaxID=1527293 RepID=UPI0006D57230|nr:Cof-type HAD-IIB family hydrolase [Paenibacillus dakarensis]